MEGLLITYMFVLDLNANTLSLFKWDSSKADWILDDVRDVDRMCAFGQRYVNEFLDTPWLQHDSIYRIILDNEEERCDTPVEFMKYILGR